MRMKMKMKMVMATLGLSLGIFFSTGCGGDTGGTTVDQGANPGAVEAEMSGDTGAEKPK